MDRPDVARLDYSPESLATLDEVCATLVAEGLGGERLDLRFQLITAKILDGEPGIVRARPPGRRQPGERGLEGSTFAAGGSQMVWGPDLE